MAGKHGSADVWALVDGYNIISNKVQALRYQLEAPLEKSDGLGDAWDEFTPTGKKKATITQEGAFFDTQTGYIHDAMEDELPANPQSTARLICVGFSGHTAGEPFVAAQEFTQAYEVLGQNGQLTKANVEHVLAGQLDEGTILQALAAKTADWDTESSSIDYRADRRHRVVPITSNSQANPSVVTTTVPHGLTSGDVVWIAGVSGSDADINGQQTATVISATTFSVAVDATTSAGTGGTVVPADSSNGGVAYQQVTAFSGFSGYVGKVRDSADDVTFADLATFTDVTASPAKERVTAAGQVDRYLAVDGNVTGSGSITVFIGFARS